MYSVSCNFLPEIETNRDRPCTAIFVAKDFCRLFINYSLVLTVLWYNTQGPWIICIYYIFNTNFATTFLKIKGPISIGLISLARQHNTALKVTCCIHCALIKQLCTTNGSRDQRTHLCCTLDCCVYIIDMYSITH